MDIEIRAVGPERHGDVTAPIIATMGIVPVPDRIEQMKSLPELDERLAAFDGDTIVGASGSFSFDMTTPGGVVDAAGLTIVAVLPTHRRRGVLTQLMRRHLDEAHRRGKPISALWASEGPIYGRFGYGMASLCGQLSIERDRAAFAEPVRATGRPRLVGEEEASRLFPSVWERARKVTPGMLSRSERWWAIRRLADPESLRRGGGLLQRMVLEIDGQPQAYALYRIHQKLDQGIFQGTLLVIEAIGATPLATRLLWRYLLDIDLIHRVDVGQLPVDHPLWFLLADPRRMHFALSDALWVRIVDVQAAVAARSYGSDASLVLEIEDSFCPWNAGRFQIDGASGQAGRTDAAADLRIDISALGSVLLGGFSFAQLAEAGRVEVITETAVARGDALFRSPRAPWCPEIF